MSSTDDRSTTQPSSPLPGYLPSRNPILDRDRELFDRTLRSFVVPGAFDAHAHLYAMDHLQIDRADLTEEDGDIDRQTWAQITSWWMGDLAPRDGLFFGLPIPPVDIDANNDFVARAARQAGGSHGLMVVRPGDDAATVESRIRADGFRGIKVYHLFADRADPGNAAIEEFLPEWAWEIADRSGLWITLHIVRAHALADPANQKSIRDHCRRYRNANLVLAHAARGFCADHTIDGIPALAGLDNVYFDTSAITEPGALMAILKQFGPRRLLYGSDYPISAMRCRSTSVGDGFFWLHGDDPRWNDWTMGALTLSGIDSLLALRQAARLLDLNDTDVERIFVHNAKDLLRD
ncbi:MAG: hypothetical protein CMJ18_00315 [Phycisphaeraceae bacterium]|nr:hypothetical protein [Phycisphaeraceae bacterium]